MFIEAMQAFQIDIGSTWLTIFYIPYRTHAKKPLLMNKTQSL
jgi:hypothetical protein